MSSPGTSRTSPRGRSALLIALAASGLAHAAVVWWMLADGPVAPAPEPIGAIAVTLVTETASGETGADLAAPPTGAGPPVDAQDDAVVPDVPAATDAPPVEAKTQIAAPLPVRRPAAPTAQAPKADLVQQEVSQTALAPTGPAVPAKPPAAPSVAPSIAASAGAPPGPLSGNPKPAYPFAARRRGQEGRVVLQVWVGADGRAMRVAVTGSSGYALLDAAARRTVQTWRFRPARQADQAVAAAVAVPIIFRLEQ